MSTPCKVDRRIEQTGTRAKQTFRRPRARIKLEYVRVENVTDLADLSHLLGIAASTADRLSIPLQAFQIRAIRKIIDNKV